MKIAPYSPERGFLSQIREQAVRAAACGDPLTDVPDKCSRNKARRRFAKDRGPQTARPGGHSMNAYPAALQFFWEGWLGRQDSNLGSRDQNPVPYRLATPQ